MTTATDLASGKGHTDENFPVASVLIHPRHRPAILARVTRQGRSLFVPLKVASS